MPHCSGQVAKLALLALCALPLVAGAPLPLRAQEQVILPECSDGSEDTDRDGMGDPCELALARTFAPLLAVRSGGCNWDATSSPARLGGGYRFLVQPTDSGAMAVYLPAYFRDCGWEGAKCWLPWVDCAPHAGDSEVIALSLVRDRVGAWGVQGIFLSAHCFGRSARDCRWYQGEDLEDFHFLEAGPVVWVAEGRQANYPGRRACDRGHGGLDSCDRYDSSYFFPIASAEQNIGSATQANPEGGCVRGSQLGSALVVADAVECFWTADAFRGWQGEGPGATPYWRYLTWLLQLPDAPARQ